MANESVIKNDDLERQWFEVIVLHRDAHDCSEPHESNPPHSTLLKIAFDVMCSTPKSFDWFFSRQELFMHFISFCLLSVVGWPSIVHTYRSRLNHFMKLGTVQTLLNSPSTLPHFHPFPRDDSSTRCLWEIRVEIDCCVKMWMAGIPRNADAVL